MLDFLKEFMRPSTMGGMLALLIPGAVLLFVPPLARIGRRWVAAVVGFYIRAIYFTPIRGVDQVLHSEKIWPLSTASGPDTACIGADLPGRFCV